MIKICTLEENPELLDQAFLLYMRGADTAFLKTESLDSISNCSKFLRVIADSALDVKDIKEAGAKGVLIAPDQIKLREARRAGLDVYLNIRTAGDAHLLKKLDLPEAIFLSAPSLRRSLSDQRFLETPLLDSSDFIQENRSD